MSRQIASDPLKEALAYSPPRRDRTYCFAGILAASVLAATGGCEQRVVPDDVDPNLELLVAGQVSVDLDILFVIDNTMSMTPWRTELGMRFEDLINGLQAAEGGLPNLHIGVVSTDMGVNDPALTTGCSAMGDRGDLTLVEGALCTAGECRFIEDVGDPTCIDPDPRNCRRRNYSGTMADAFITLVADGPPGCEYISPLEAMYKALDGSNPANNGFLRPNAALAVVVIADSDDCSLADPGLLDFNDTTIGPPGPIRCFGDAVVCDPDDPYSIGAKTGCVANTDPGFLFPTQKYVDFLQALKAEQNEPVFFTAIGGDLDNINVIPHPMMTMQPVIMPSCSLDPGGPGARDAEPTIRLAKVAGDLGDRGQFGSLCTDDLQASLLAIADGLNSELQGTCLLGDLFDRDRDANNGIQPNCSVIESDAQGENATDIPNCLDNGNQPPCFDTELDTVRCDSTDTKLNLIVRRIEPPRPGAVVAMACDINSPRTGFVKTSYYDCSATGASSGRAPTDRGSGWAWLLLGALALAIRQRFARLIST